MNNEGVTNPIVKSKTSQQELDDITSKLDKLQLEFDRKKSELLLERKRIIDHSNKNHLIRNKDKYSSGSNQKNILVNHYKVGQLVRINNDYSGDYGISSKGTIGTIIKVNKVQVNIKNKETGKYYTRSYKNISLVEEL
jgi:hypothetical protein